MDIASTSNTKACDPATQDCFKKEIKRQKALSFGGVVSSLIEAVVGAAGTFYGLMIALGTNFGAWLLELPIFAKILQGVYTEWLRAPALSWETLWGQTGLVLSVLVALIFLYKMIRRGRRTSALEQIQKQVQA